MGTITYTKVNDSRGWWDITATGYAFGSETFSQRPIFGVVDTGSTLLYLPSDMVREFYSLEASAAFSDDLGVWLFGCNATLPSVTLGIEGARITVPSEYLNYYPNGDGTCWGGIQESPPSLGYSIFGDMLLKAAFVVFDAEGPRMGWASKSL